MLLGADSDLDVVLDMRSSQTFAVQGHRYWQGHAYALHHEDVCSSLLRAYHLGVQHALMSCRCKR